MTERRRLEQITSSIRKIIEFYFIEKKKLNPRNKSNRTAKDQRQAKKVIKHQCSMLPSKW